MSCSSCGSGHTKVQSSYTGKGSTRVVSHSVETCDDCGFAQKISKTMVGKWTELPLYDQPSLFDDLDVIVGSNDEGKAWRLPIARIMAGGSLNKLTDTIDKGIADISVPTGQIVPVFKPSANESLEMAVGTDAQHQAHYLAYANSPNDENLLAIQNSGFLTFPRTHKYEVGQVYYLHPTKAGEVTTVKPSTGISQPLFAVKDELTLAVNVVLV